MDLYAILDQVIDLLRQRQRVTYRALKVQFQLDDEALEALKEELVYGQRVAVDEEGRVLVWTGETGGSQSITPPVPQPPLQPATQAVHPTPVEASPAGLPSSNAERRQLTVLFCDVVDSTRLASQLDPEDYREVVRAYQAACTESIQRFDGHIAQYLGDGLLVYFGYPQAHEDDPHRAVRTGLGMLEAMRLLNTRLEQAKGILLAIRVGIHTGLVVVGEMGGGGRQEQLALGDTPNIAARLQGFATPDTVVISAATFRLVRGYFTAQELGAHSLKGVTAPVHVYRILRASAAQSRLDIAGATGFTPLVGRESEVLLLLERWAHSQDSRGQVVLLSGEAGIGKSRLVEVLRERVRSQGATPMVFRCSPYHQHSALYPVIEHVQRVLHWHRHETPEAKLDALEQALQTSRLPLEEVTPLFAALLSLPQPAHYPLLHLTPQRQRQKTHEALVTWLLEETERQPVLAVWEDLHWADPSTLELLGLVLDQAPTARLLTLLTCRPEFHPPWATRPHLTQVTLTRLGRPQVEAMITSLTGGKALPTVVVAQVVAKTDGIPLFVEELVKMLLESGLLRNHEDHYELTEPLPTLAIPATLQDSLMARLDRLSTVKTVAQLGATLGRQFAYDLLQAISPLDEDTLQQGLRQLAEAELLYQRGLPPQATYRFKHALIQDAAYQSLLKSTRQQYHQRIAQVLVAQFPETAETQPELVAHHYTEAGWSSEAIVYWHRAGQRALQRSANVEAIGHLTQGLAVLTTLPDTSERTRQELMVQLALGVALIATKGYGALEVEHVYLRAQTLCQALGEMPRLLQVLLGLEAYYVAKAQLGRAHELAEQCLTLAQRVQHPVRLLNSHHTLGLVLVHLGKSTAALPHFEQGMSLYKAQPHPPRQNLHNPGVACLSYAAWALWWLGYPDQALQRGREALALAHALAHPYSLAYVLCYGAALHQYRREAQRAAEHAAMARTLATEHDFPLWSAMGTWLYGWALAEQGQIDEGLLQIRQGVTAWRATGAALVLPTYLATLAEVYGKAGQKEEAQQVLREALALVEDTGERFWEAELYRLTGELLRKRTVSDAHQAETCFQRAMDIARNQHAKSFELRAATSLARLWQQQGKRNEARQMLAEVYNWFTEGFEALDLQDAQALLDELA